ncbi:MAG TPA: flavodoxin domain-containing protein [Nitrososphaerales archaeon]|nr:flavodoxin domain-containing protein [Nitrososphaerales archaeon]
MALRACVVYDSRYGNTEKVANSLGSGLRGAGIETACFNAKYVPPDSLKQYDVVCVGAPTEWLTASKPMKAFLDGLRGQDLSGRFGFAFDTKLDRPLSGSASRLIERELKRLGLQIVAPHESATVYLENGSVRGAWMKEGEEKRFEAVGRRLGEALLAGAKS